MSIQAWGESRINLCLSRKDMGKFLDDLRDRMELHADECSETGTDNDASYSVEFILSSPVEGAPEIEVLLLHHTDCDWTDRFYVKA